MQVHRCLSLLTAGTPNPAATAVSILSLERPTVTFSAAELGSVGKFRGSHLVPDDSADAMYMCGLLLASCDDKAVWF